MNSNYWGFIEIQLSDNSIYLFAIGTVGILFLVSQATTFFKI